eukprot:CAMPEP_0175143892 /NCGR_PEP_ID=MMETSP0087-20121206/13772_1 /TAXON_ID=136419 /ORGANISM="Unknown Unknown, Strain D1" /LENGTH=350 /DNA_ID=CAMNT_0016428187 /DNA_START=61 /DNA_END=1113 /DNA_ORIENTATION=-
MKRLVLVQPHKDVAQAQLRIEEVDVPTPRSGQVLIRVSAAPINPSDYGEWRHVVEGKEFGEPRPIGKEGSGVVVAVGSGFTNGLLGKKVGFTNLPRGQGAYSEYVCASAMQSAFPLPESVPVEAAASFFVNPYTVYGILDTAQSRGSPGLVHTAAASQLGQMMVKYCKAKKVPLINVVRRQEQKEILQALGAEHVVVTGDNENWKKELKTLVTEQKVTCAFDAVGGDMAGDLTDILPPKGHYFIYGGLAGKGMCNINPLDIIYRGITVNGFFLGSWIKNGGSLSMLMRLKGASAAVLPALTDGWSSSQFVDCSLDSAFSEFQKMWSTGFTNKKLRIVFKAPEPAQKALAE